MEKISNLTTEDTERATPETDAVASMDGNWDTKALRMTAHARRLERERKELSSYLDADHYAACNAELRKKLDEALKRAEYLAKELADPPADVQEAVLNKLGLWNVVRELGKENPWLKEPYIP